jgi:multidrug efflux pump subunit AcrA (membrane-fusion protein)
MSFAVVMTLTGRSYPSVPEVAVQWGGDGSFLWAVRDGHAVRVDVAILQRQDGEVLVDAPLETGDLVVVEGVQRMREGTAVARAPADRQARREPGS